MVSSTSWLRSLGHPATLSQRRPVLTCWLPAIVLACAVAGCTRPIVRMDNPLPIDSREYSRIFAATVVELRHQGFIINRHDYRFGVITTRPQPSPTLMEPWQRQNTTAYQGLESTLNSQRRTVTVTLEPAEIVTGKAAAATETTEGQAYRLRVEVLIERQQHPALQATGSPSARTLVRPLTAVPRELQDRGITGPYWEPLKRDPYMEQQLIARIVHRAMVMEESR